MFAKKKDEEKHFLRNPILAGRKELILLVVDMQEKFAPVISDFDKIVKNVVTLVKSFQMYQLPILVTEQYPQGLGKTVKQITDCFPILEVTEKSTFSCMQSSQFVMKLDALKMRKIVVCGIESHVCVHQTVHDLIHRQYQVWVPQDTTDSRDPANRELALHRMEKAGAIMTSVEMLLFEMAFQAGTESFKRIQQMIK